MSATLEARLLKLKASIEDARRATDQAQGRLDGLNKRLKDEFGCATMKEAQRKAEKLETEAARLEVEVAQGLEQIEASITERRG